MLELKDLSGRVLSRKGQTYIELSSATKVDKITGGVLNSDYDFCPINKVTELTTVSGILTYANGRTEKETHYFLRVDGCLKLVSEQAFKTIKAELLKNKTIVKGKNIPNDTTLRQDYLNKFYKYSDEF